MRAACGSTSQRLPGCAKYTRSHPVTALALLLTTDTATTARQLEARIKRLTRAQKDALIADPARLPDLCPALAGADIRPVPDARSQTISPTRGKTGQTPERLPVLLAYDSAQAAQLQIAEHELDNVADLQPVRVDAQVIGLRIAPALGGEEVIVRCALLIHLTDALFRFRGRGVRARALAADAGVHRRVDKQVHERHIRIVAQDIVRAAADDDARLARRDRAG